nr:site-specific DNA-methyltransferase [Nitratidesulfovibrio liaohensis]
MIESESVDVTITSPPYFDMKDYGCDGQIGFGQTYDAYLDDLKNVFEGVFRCTKRTGTLWVVIDALRKSGEVVPLPFDFDRKMREIGWKLREIIIWEKDKTVPWVHKGQVRNCFEYVLMFSKSDEYNFYVDNVRSCENIKKWWVKYPERYNPNGKAPGGVWDFPIPTQGSWGSGYVRHFCPLPDELIERILQLSSVEGDVVLDPFSGSGAVLAKAFGMNRAFVGIELNSEYIDMFHRYLAAVDGGGASKDIEGRSCSKDFYRAILDLRVLKYARVLYKKINDELDGALLAMRAEYSTGCTKKKNALVVVEYKMVLRQDVGCAVDKVLDVATRLSGKAPLSKFGIEPYFVTCERVCDVVARDESVSLYTERVTHKVWKKVAARELSDVLGAGVIISSICVDFDESNYE